MKGRSYGKNNLPRFRPYDWKAKVRLSDRESTTIDFCVKPTTHYNTALQGSIINDLKPGDFSRLIFIPKSSMMSSGYRHSRSTTSFRPEKLLFSSFKIRAKLVIHTGISCSIKALAMHPAKKLLPVPTPPQIRRPVFFFCISAQCSTYWRASFICGLHPASFSNFQSCIKTTFLRVMNFLGRWLMTLSR